MKITATQIAKLAGVSQSAVSKVLNNSPIRISTDRREKIIQIAKKYNYTPNRAAKTLKTGKHNTIAIIVYDLADAFANECINAVEEYLDTTYYQAYWVSCKHAHKANQDPIEFLQNVSQTVDGIVIIHAYDYITDSDIMFLKRTTNFPIITIIRKVPGNRISSVTIDNNIGIHLLMDHLKKLGHTDIGFLYCDDHNITARERFNTFKNFLLDYSFKYNPLFYFLSDGTALCGYKIGIELFSLESIPSAVITFNDLSAIGIIKAAYDKNINIPSQVSLASFDNINITSYLTPSLTTVAIDFNKLCSLALNKIISEIENDSGNQVVEHIIIEPVLIVRQSTYNFNSNQ